MRRAIAPVLEGARLERRRDPRSAPGAAVRPGARRGRARRRARSRGRAPWQVSDCSVRVGPLAPDPPPDDGVAAPRGARDAGRRSSHACRSQLGQRIGRRLPRRAALRHLGAVRARRAPRPTSRPGSGRSRSAGFSAARSRRAARRTAGAAEVRAARPADARGAREHLRRRGALAEPAPSAAGGRRPRAGGAGRAPPRDPARAADRDRAAGLDAPRLRVARRSVRLDAGRVPRLRARRGAVRPLRRRRSSRIVVGGRTTTFCPRCQLPRRNAVSPPRAAGPYAARRSARAPERSSAASSL